MPVKHVFCGALLALTVALPISKPLWADAPVPPEYSRRLEPPPTSAVMSTLMMAQIMGMAVSDETRRKLDTYTSKPPIADVQKMIADIGVTVEPQRTSLDKILASGAPAVLKLQNPDEYVLLLDGVKDESGKQWLRLLDRDESNAHVVSLTDIESRFSGEALIPQRKTADNSPRLQLDSADYHFVLRAIGQLIEHEYRVTNAGKSDLELYFMQTYCGCGGTVKFGMDAGLSTVLKPGQSVPVKATFTPQTPASISRTAVMKTNDPLQPYLYLTFRGEPSHVTQASTQKLNFEVKKGQSAEQTFEVSGPSMLQLGQPMLDNDKFSATAVRTFADDDKAVWRVTVKLGVKASAGQHQAMLAVPTNDPDNGTITIPLVAVVK